jgi:type IV pilus assembly protein PilE
MTTKSSGFTLIELLVVVAILGIIAAIGISSYNGYVSRPKQKSVENAMMQMSLGQTEYYSNNGYYYPQKTSNNCSPNSTTTNDIEKKLLGDGTTGPDVIPDDLGYNVCIWRSSTGNYGIVAKQDGSNPCEIKMSDMGTYTRNNNC